MKLGPAWSSPAEKERWERRFDAWADTQQREKRNGEGPPDEGTYAKIGSRVYRDRRIKAAMPFISIIVQWAVRKGGWTEEYQEHVADKLGVTDRTVRRWQKIADEAEMVKTETRRGRGRRNRYTVLPAALPPPSPQRPRGRVAQQNKPDKNVRSTLTELETSLQEASNSASPPLPPPPQAEEGGTDGAPGRRAELLGARDGRSAARATSTVPTADASRAPPLAPAEFAGSTLARQGASAIRVRAPP